MDVINISRSRRFLRERPIHVNLFDRPRLVVDLLCLEPNQEEARHGLDRSDSLLLLIEGEARLRTGVQIESLQAMDAVLVPPGQAYEVTNTGAGQMTALVILSPKPTRAGEVRVPGDTRPFRNVRQERDDDGGAHVRPPRPAPSGEENARPPRDRPYPRRDGPPASGAGRAPYPRRDGPPASGAGRAPYPRRDGPPAPGAGRAPYPRRDGPPAPGAGRAPYPRRDGPPAPGNRRAAPAKFGRPRPGRRDEAPATDDRSGPRRGSTGARPPRRGEGEAPVWYPKPKPAWRPRGAPPAASGRGRPTGGRGAPGANGAQGRTGNLNSSERPSRSPRPATGGGPRDNRAGPRARSEKKTGDARRASRGQGPLSGRRGPGRSAPRTSTPRRSPE